jgi:hypothetical protein
MPTIIITSPDLNGKTDLSINGLASSIPHNKNVKVNEGELEVLQNASLTTATLTVLGDDDEAEDEVTSLGGLPDPKAGTEGSAIQAPATPAALSSEPNPLLQEGSDEEPLKTGDTQLLEDSAKGGDTIIAPESEKPAPKKRPGRKPAAKKAAAAATPPESDTSDQGGEKTE